MTVRNETLESHSATGRTETTLRDRYDSIYVLHDRSMNTVHDTVWAHEKITEFRYRYLHDTVFVARTDTLIHVQEVERKQEIQVTRPRFPTWLDLPAFSSLILLVLFLLYRIYSQANIPK